MPTYDFVCGTCEKAARAYRSPSHPPPLYCCNACKNEAMGKRGRSGPVSARWPITPDIHEKIKRVYQRRTGAGEVRDLARRLGYPRWKITRYAQDQGWAPMRTREPRWSDAEIRVLKRNAHRSMDAIQERLKSKGFSRTRTAISLKRKRLRLPANLSGYSASQVALGLGVDNHFITRAIQRGALKARKRGTHRTEAQGGDTWYILPLAIKNYLADNIHEVDIRKVDKYWFVDILTWQSI